MFASALADRDGLAESTFALEVLAAAALAALTTAITAWSAGGGALDLVALVDEAFATLRAA